jgi:hypothetical protein
MGSILTKITEILNEGNNYEERREYRILPNYFFCLDGLPLTGSDTDNGEQAETTTERIKKEDVCQR